MGSFKSTCAFCVVTILGSLFITAGIYLTFNWIEVFTRLRGEETSLSPQSGTYKGFANPPIPLYFDVYLFNWTNPKDFYKGSKIKPHFQQLGPYRFREDRTLFNVTWHKHNHSMTYQNFPTFHFMPEMSNGSLTDKITSVDSVTFETFKRLTELPFFLKKPAEMALNMFGREITITRTADEWIFKGITHPILKVAAGFGLVSKNYTKMGYLFGRNHSALNDGIINMYTGTDSLLKMGLIHNWNYSNRTVYPGDCGTVKGSLGSFFTSNLKPNTPVYIFMPNYCRYIVLDHVDTVEIYGVKGFKYAGSYRTLDNGTLYPENKCFCNQNDCGPAGVMNISPCVQNASIRISFPHFYLADPSYLSAVEGLQPDKEKHEFFFVLEPNTGFPMHVGGGFQANYLLQPLNFSPYRNIPETVIPLMWAEERMLLPEEIISNFSILTNIILGGQLMAGVLLALGVILVFWYPFKQFKQLWHDPKAKSKIAIATPQLVESAVQNVVAHMKRPYEQLPLREHKKWDISVSEEPTTENLLKTALRENESVDETSHN